MSRARVPSRRELTFFERTVEDLETFVAEQDVFWVGGGSTANLLAVWRLHGLDVLLREAYERGAVLCGVSAGMNCWFEASTTDSFGPTLGAAARRARLPARARPARTTTARSSGGRCTARLVDTGALPPGWACDDYAALHFRGGDVREAVTLREGAQGYRVEPGNETRASRPSSSASSPASSSTVTPSRSAFSSLEPGEAPATT